MANQTKLPDNAELAGKVLDAQSQERGMLGKVFGGREHAPTNIVALIAVLLLVMLGLTLFIPVQDGIDRGGIVTRFSAQSLFQSVCYLADAATNLLTNRPASGRPRSGTQATAELVRR